jgi:REP element-mobilizing transposase RayT
MTYTKQLNFFNSNPKVKTSSLKKRSSKHKIQPVKRGRKQIRPENSFGGKYCLNYNPKTKRPLNEKKALHLVLRSTLAKGKLSFKNTAFEEKIWAIIKKHSSKNNIKIYEYANASNHLHLLIRAKAREDYVRFIKTITGLIARLVSGIEKGSRLKRKFWDARPFTRIVSFSKNDFKRVKLYLLRNTLETIGWIPYISRSKKLPPEWKLFWKNKLEAT